ncbi:SBDS protein C-terminal domain-containing protein [Calycina marina]|uniref:Ribosome maturation protein SDO1 n=1 Tax=Calycina marina TaxID=1763456 RepID=A0A9P8CHZ4_9HELO|nr:SBDS protein C-terminal domain-containing protein [Calycina marina]
MRVNQPSNQIKLTNVSLVRLKKGKKRFEIACYKNKVLEYRSGIETDLDNVLQIEGIFLNVSKGQTAPTADLQKAFGAKESNKEIILEILQKGELQVGEKERAAQLERVHNEVVGMVASKLVDPKTKRVYTTGMIDKALEMLSSQGSQAQPDKNEKPVGEEGETKKKGHMWTGVVATKSAKSQALEAMKALIQHQPIPVMRARMRLRVTCSLAVLKQNAKVVQKECTEDDREKFKATVKDRILSYVEQIESQDTMGAEWEIIGFVEPGAFKGLGDFIGSETKGQGRVEVLDMAVTTSDE